MRNYTPSISMNVPIYPFYPCSFLIYINDLANVCKYTMPIFFACDSHLFQIGKILEGIEMKINSELTEMAEWLKVNKLTLNINKINMYVI